MVLALTWFYIFVLSSMGLILQMLQMLLLGVELVISHHCLVASLLTHIGEITGQSSYPLYCTSWYAGFRIFCLMFLNYMFIIVNLDFASALSFTLGDDNCYFMCCNSIIETTSMWCKLMSTCNWSSNVCILFWVVPYCLWEWWSQISFASFWCGPI